MEYVLLVTFYFLPFIVALMRSSKRTAGIFVLNLVFGLTILGWFGALIWALASDTREIPS